MAGEVALRPSNALGDRFDLPVLLGEEREDPIGFAQIAPAQDECADVVPPFYG
jgi:hypothetical protein